MGKFYFFDSLTTTAAALELRFVLFSETISSREEIPTPFFVHLPDIGLLTGVLSLILVDQVHQEEPEIDNNQDENWHATSNSFHGSSDQTKVS